MNFGKTLELLKEGKKVAREGWNGKGMYLWLLPKAEIPKAWIKDPLLLSVYEKAGVETLLCEESIRMYTAQGTIITGWKPSNTDMFAEDWVEVN